MGKYIKKVKQPIEAIFLSRISVGDDCWIWQGAPVKNKMGYGRIKRGGVSTYAHRKSYEIFKGKIPKGMFVCHHCDVGICVNPKHLFVGTQQDNVDDAGRKGRRATGARCGACTHPESLKRGEEHPLAKLTESDIKEIRRVYVPGKYGAHRIAKRFGVSKQSIQCVLKKRTWIHV